MSDWRDDPAWPDVDVVMPILNEAEHLATAVAAIRVQNYPGLVRIFVAVGPSTDGTEEVAAEFARSGADLTVIDNPSARTPAALNLAIAAGRAPVVVRVDGHSQLSDGYVAQAVETLRRTGAANVGGMQVPVPRTPFEAAVATATTSWLGTGGATYRVGGSESSVDTVFLGVFDRAAIEAVGLFDERLIRNQDYELNIRLRKHGYDVIFDPLLSVGYTPRGSWRALGRQYRQYGTWKAVVVRLHPASLRLRQLAPAIVTTGLIAATIGALRLPRLLVVPFGYGVTLMVVARHFAPANAARVVLALATMHLSWGLGFLSAPIRSVFIWRRQL